MRWKQVPTETGNHHTNHIDEVESSVPTKTGNHHTNHIDEIESSVLVETGSALQAVHRWGRIECAQWNRKRLTSCPSMRLWFPNFRTNISTTTAMCTEAGADKYGSVRLNGLVYERERTMNSSILVHYDQPAAINKTLSLLTSQACIWGFNSKELVSIQLFVWIFSPKPNTTCRWETARWCCLYMCSDSCVHLPSYCAAVALSHCMTFICGSWGWKPEGPPFRCIAKTKPTQTTTEPLWTRTKPMHLPLNHSKPEPNPCTNHWTTLNQNQTHAPTTEPL